MAAFACDIWRTVFVCVTTTHNLYYITYWKMQAVILAAILSTVLNQMYLSSWHGDVPNIVI
jgi:hypothetical protein